MSKISIAGNAAGTATFAVVAPATNTNRTLVLPDATDTLVGSAAPQTLTNKVIQDSIIRGGVLALMTAVSVSGTEASIDFIDIPSWANRVTVQLAGVSLNGTSTFVLQLGTSAGLELTGYSSVGFTPGSSFLVPTNGFSLCGVSAAAQLWSGLVVLTRVTGDTWVLSGTISAPPGYIGNSAGSKTLSGALERLRLTTAIGTNLFDAGSINVMYEG